MIFTAIMGTITLQRSASHVALRNSLEHIIQPPEPRRSGEREKLITSWVVILGQDGRATGAVWSKLMTEEERGGKKKTLKRVKEPAAEKRGRCNQSKVWVS